MKLKRWLLLFLAVCLVCVAAFAGFNALVDPFGVFGDPLLDWYGYNMTENPRVAKVAYLEEHHEDYDSYVVGSSKASSIPVDELNDYLDASFYNMTWYGGKLWDEQRMIRYLLDRYEVENIVLTVDPSIAVLYRDDTDDLKQRMHCKVDGSSPLSFYASYLFCNPSYALDKLAAYLERGFLQSADSVYLPDSGVYNKQRRDAVPINDLDSYFQAEAGPFTDKASSVTLPYIQESVDVLREIKGWCDDAGVNLTVVWVPISDEEMDTYNRDEVEKLLLGVAEVTDSWNFMGYGSVQCDPRYYYDNHHFRNCVGTMMLARMFGNEDIYIPEGFGVYDTANTLPGRLNEIFTRSAESESYVTQVPILMYHSFVGSAEEVTASTMISAAAFEEQLQALKAAGYQTVTLADLQNYVYHGASLPDKPVVLVADDGYADNLTIAAPILEQYGCTMSIAVIGCSVGKDTYKDTNAAIFPHFSLEKVKGWVNRGVIEVISHSYDMHQVTSLDGEDCRRGVLPLDGEREADYVAALIADFTRSKEQLEGLGVSITAMAYPNGKYNEISEIVLHDLGFAVTLSINPGTNHIIQGIPQSLYQLRRNWITDNMTGQDIIELLQSFESVE